MVKRGHRAVTEHTQTPKFSARRRIIYSGGDKQCEQVPLIRLGYLKVSPQEWFLRRKILVSARVIWQMLIRHDSHCS